jgi:nucleoid-associated protein YgaU
MSRNPAKLISLMPPGEVTFDINPEQITMQRQAQVTGRGTASSNTGSPAGSSPSIFRGAQPSKINLKDVTFFGPDTKERCDQLLNWMSPGGGLLGALVAGAIAALTGINLASRLPLVIFQWGPPEIGFMYECNVTSATINYTRFATSGIPIRAVCAITLQEQPSPLGTLPTNPTSGGLPGRQSHTVTAGESLPGIAMSRYGTPGRWRAVAECNDVDDPLRVRPGDRLYLPNPDELMGGTR